MEYAKLQQAMPRVYRYEPKLSEDCDAQDELRKAICRQYEKVQAAQPSKHVGFPQLRDMPTDVDPVYRFHAMNGPGFGLTGRFMLTWQWPQSLANIRAFEEVLQGQRHGLKPVPLRAVPTERDLSNVPLHSLWLPLSPP